MIHVINQLNQVQDVKIGFMNIKQNILIKPPILRMKQMKKNSNDNVKKKNKNVLMRVSKNVRKKLKNNYLVFNVN